MEQPLHAHQAGTVTGLSVDGRRHGDRRQRRLHDHLIDSVRADRNSGASEVIGGTAFLETESIMIGAGRRYGTYRRPGRAHPDGPGGRR